MTYSAEISRKNPTCFLFLIDQSGSMDERMDSAMTKSSFLADVLNKTLYQLVVQCTRGAEDVHDYFHVGVIGYGGTNISSGFGGALSSEIVHPLSAIANNPLRVEERTKKISDGVGGLIEQKIKFPVWFSPVNSGGTPMCEALRRAAEVLVEWCGDHPDAYPPTLIHVTDGASTDGDPEQIAKMMQGISTSDGEVLLFNLHISTAQGDGVLFPASEAALPDQFAKMLYRMSSHVPATLAQVAQSKGLNCSTESKFFGYKADIKGIVDFFDIGTRPSNLMIEDMRDR